MIQPYKPRIANQRPPAGNFVKAALKHDSSGSGKHIYAAADYYSPSQITTEFSQVTGKPAAAIQLSEDTFKSYLSPKIAQEMLENMLLLEDPGYYGGADLKESVSLLDEKPVSWKDFVEKNKEKWL